MVLVGLPETLGTPRFPTAASPRLYPRIPAGAGGLPRDSVALLDQTCALDVLRLGEYLGTLTPDAFTPIQQGLARMMTR